MEVHNDSVPVNFGAFIIRFVLNLYFCIMETLIVHPKNQKQLAAIEAVLKALDIAFKREDSYNPDFEKKIEKSKAEVRDGKTTKVKPADIWNLGDRYSKGRYSFFS